MVNPWRLRQSYGLDTFCETGCYQGRSLAEAQAAGFGKLISCDISSECVLAARARFPHAAILHCESTVMLGPCLDALQAVMGRTLFWLDAHYPATFGLAETEENRYPLPQELRLIREGKRGWEQDVFALDDLRVIRDRNNPRWRPGELTGEDASLYMDITLDELYAPFAATHELQLLHAEEGVMLLLPQAA